MTSLHPDDLEEPIRSMNELYLSQAESLVDREDLTAWESDFIPSILEQLKSGVRSLSARQIQILSKVWNKYRYREQGRREE